MQYVPKGWGWELIVVNNEKYCGKILHVAKGRKCSIHYHNEKDETFYVFSGQILLKYMTRYEALKADAWPTFFNSNPSWLESSFNLEAHKLVLKPGDSFHVPPGLIHQFVGEADSCVAEFSTQHKDEDSIRIVKGD